MRDRARAIFYPKGWTNRKALIPTSPEDTAKTGRLKIKTEKASYED